MTSCHNIHMLPSGCFQPSFLYSQSKSSISFIQWSAAILFHQLIHNREQSLPNHLLDLSTHLTEKKSLSACIVTMATADLSVTVTCYQPEYFILSLTHTDSILYRETITRMVTIWNFFFSATTTWIFTRKIIHRKWSQNCQFFNFYSLTIQN